MTITAVIILLLVGLALIWLEFLVIPGTTIAGIGGIILMGTGIYLAYHFIGPKTGMYSLMGAAVMLVISIVVFLKSNTWKKLSLNDNIDSKVDTYEEESIKKGDEGICISRLAPSGRICTGAQEVEAESVDGLLDPQTKVVIIKVLRNKVYVKLKT